MKQKVLFLLAGMCLGIVLVSGGQAAANYLQAQPSTQAVYVDGQKADMEAYNIHDNNFVMLRDIGEAVGFNVYWDGKAVQVESDKPYTGLAPGGVQPTPAPTPTPTPAPSGKYTINVDHWSREDFSQQANPAVFTGVYDRALYNTFRQTLVDGRAIDPPAYTMVAKGDDYSAVVYLMGRMSGMTRYEHYVPKNFSNYWQYLDYFAVSGSVPDVYQSAVDFIQPVIAKVRQMSSEREKVTYLNDYLCSLLAYDRDASVGIPQTFAPHSNELKGACGSYAVAFKFLCGAADIPCFTISTSDHTWNLVYVDNQWLHVDVSANDYYNRAYILMAESYPNHPDQAPEATAFIKELLVPGSTK